LEGSPDKVDELEILAEGFENGDRKVRLIKVFQAYTIFKELIAHYAVNQLLSFIKTAGIGDYETLLHNMPGGLSISKWVNAGGQLIRDTELQKLVEKIRDGKTRDWEQIHEFYARQGNNYEQDKLVHAIAELKEATGISCKRAGKEALRNLLLQSVATKEWMTKGIYDSRAKDYAKPFRKMVYDTPEEMNAVVGALQNNSFIRQEKEALKNYRKETEAVIRKCKL
jgi:hypothetical protein